MGFDSIDRQFKAKQPIKLECRNCGCTDDTVQSRKPSWLFWAQEPPLALCRQCNTLTKPTNKDLLTEHANILHRFIMFDEAAFISMTPDNSAMPDEVTESMRAVIDGTWPPLRPDPVRPLASSFTEANPRHLHIPADCIKPPPTIEEINEELTKRRPLDKLPWTDQMTETGLLSNTGTKRY